MTHLGIPAAIGLVAGAGAVRRFRTDLARARERLATVPRQVLQTEVSDVEYADVGTGAPLLVVHGIFGVRDQGLASFDNLLPDRRVVAPSRFGYLGSTMPPDATPALQADVFAELLDTLNLDRVDVFGYSAGSTLALQFAMRHPERVNAFVVMCGNWPGGTETAPPAFAKIIFRSDAMMWLASALAGPALLRFIAGVPRGFDLTADDRVKARHIMETVFPVRERSEGIVFDAFVGNADVNNYPLEGVTTPTLIVHSRDDTLAPYATAEAAAGRIPGARLITHESGGHLMLGRKEASAIAISSFLSRAESAL